MSYEKHVESKRKKLVTLYLIILCNFLILKKTKNMSNLETLRIAWETIMYIKEYNIVLSQPYPRFKKGNI